MKRVIAVAGVLVVLASAPVAGAQSATGADPHRHDAPAASPPVATPAPSGHGQMPMAMCAEMMRGGGTTGAHGPGMMGGQGSSMMGAGMMGGGRGGTTMGGMMGRGMMGRGMMDDPAMDMPGPSTDPKAMSQMMEMRGEMMKAMGDIMMKYARKMRPAEEPAKK